jgi:3-oxoacyl-[acyl-carrier protein] reductase
MTKLAGRMALVTGAARGIGAVIARRLASEGAAVMLVDIDRDEVEAQAASLRATGAEATARTVDVSREASVVELFAHVERSCGRLDVLVNNAGVLGLDAGKRPLVATMPLSLWQRTLEVNLTGTFLMCRGAAPLMQRCGWGRIINMSSRVGRTRTGPGNAHYAASKAGLIGFSRVLASELGGDGITVNCIAPSKIVTAMTTAVSGIDRAFEAHVAETVVGRLGTADDVAGVVAFLCSEEASFVTGTVIDVTGGSFMP